MTKEEVQHLATLARIELSPAELEKFTKEMSAILSYVGVVKDLVAEVKVEEPTVGVRYNVFRTDVVTNKADEYTADLLAEMPKTEGRFMVVKKIIQTE